MVNFTFQTTRVECGSIQVHLVKYILNASSRLIPIEYLSFSESYALLRNSKKSKQAGVDLCQAHGCLSLLSTGCGLV